MTKQTPVPAIEENGEHCVNNTVVVVSNTKDGVTLDFYRDYKTVFSFTMYNSDCVYKLAGVLVKHGCKVFDQKFSEWVERQVLTNKEVSDD
jgi:hypothetical protein